MFADLQEALKYPYKWLYPSWISFLIRYRRTMVGPLWILIGPAFFVLLLGTLFAAVMKTDAEIFIPHLTIGFIVWIYISGTVISAPRLYTIHRAMLLQGSVNHMELVLKLLTNGMILFAHQFVLIILVLIYFQIAPTVQLIYLLPAYGLMVVHSIWITVALGILGARYQDINEIVEMIIRVGFLATPIIWMAEEGGGGRGAVVGKYLLFNPFYHVLEPFRAALLGREIAPISWIISMLIAVGGIFFARFLYNRLHHLVSLWV